MYNAAELESLISRLIARQLPKEEWTHPAHIAAAIWHLWAFPPDDALFLMKGRITRHNESVGTPNSDTEGYHETLTQFWLKAVRNFIKKNHFNNAAEAVVAVEGTELLNSELPLKYWSKELLFSTMARKEWVAPDLGTPEWL